MKLKFADLTLLSMEEEDLLDKPERVFLRSVTDILPYEAYLVLKQQFGVPVSESFDDDKTQWQYFFKIPGAYIEIYDWKLGSFSIGVFAEDGKREAGEKTAEAVYSLIKQHVPRVVTHLKSAIKEPKGMVIQNPYLIYYSSADKLLEIAEQVESWQYDPELRGRQPSIINKWLIYEYNLDFCRSAFFLYLASFEGLLNLIYELYLRKELRDERIYERLSREQIDIKLRLAPVYCSCFRSSLIDHQSEEFKKFHTIVNLRNDFIHANLTQSMRSPVVETDGYTFVVDQRRTAASLPRNISELNTTHIREVKNSVDEMVKQIIFEMAPRFRREMMHILELESIVIEYEDGELIVL